MVPDLDILDDLHKIYLTLFFTRLPVYNPIVSPCLKGFFAANKPNPAFGILDFFTLKFLYFCKQIQQWLVLCVFFFTSFVF